jgi:hypothetical protein
VLAALAADGGVREIGVEKAHGDRLLYTINAAVVDGFLAWVFTEAS